MSVKQKAEVIAEQRQRELSILAAQGKTSCSSVCVGFFIFLLTLGTGALLIVLGVIQTNTDFLIAGGVFGFGGVVFLVMCITKQCLPCLKNKQRRSRYIKDVKDFKEST